jgi:hypothetical protein
MAFTIEELENIANSMLDYHYKTPEVRAQTLQDKPLLKALSATKKPMPGGKGEVDFGLKGEYTTGIQGFEHDDEVDYDNPANTKRGRAPWKLIHAGISFTMHELLKGGISITDTADGSGERNHSDRDKMVLAELLNEKIEDMKEGSDRALNQMLWRDGTQDSSLVPGIRSFIVDDPTSATVVLGVDQSANSWWRNRASLNLTASTASDQNVINTLQTEWRQLRRYGGRPNKALAGSDWIEWIEKELRSKGNYTERGWMSKEATDGGMADVSFKGVTFEYDPTLDDEGLSKYCYILDTRTIELKPIQGEDGKDHRPARPENKYVFYRAKTWAWALICRQRNAQGVYSIA